MDDLSNRLSLTVGYVLSTPTGVLLPHSFRSSRDEAIASVFTDAEKREEHWSAAQAQGMTCEFVYARIFLPKFFSAAAVVARESQETAGAA